MTINSPLSQAEKVAIAERLAKTECYGKPRRVWVEDGHVFVESHGGTVVNMTPEVAIDLGRLLSSAGADSLINRVMEENSSSRSNAPRET